MSRYLTYLVVSLLLIVVLGIWIAQLILIFIIAKSEKGKTIMSDAWESLNTVLLPTQANRYKIANGYEILHKTGERPYLIVYRPNGKPVHTEMLEGKDVGKRIEELKEEYGRYRS